MSKSVVLTPEAIKGGASVENTAPVEVSQTQPASPSSDAAPEGQAPSATEKISPVEVQPIGGQTETPATVIKLREQLAQPSGGQQGADSVVEQVAKQQAAQAQEPDEASVISKLSGGKFKSWDEIESLINTPAKEVSYPSFADDLSKQVYENLVAGKLDDVAEVLYRQKRLKNLENLSGEELIKETMAIQHPEWDREDIEDEYAIRFESLDSDDPTEQRRAKRLFREEERKAKEFLTQQRKEIKLPQLEGKTATAEQAPQIDAATVEKLRTQYLSGVAKVKNDFKGYEFKVSDDDMEIETRFNIDNAEREAFLKNIENFDIDELFEKQYFNPNTGYDVDALARDMWMIQRDENGVPNYQRLVTSQIRQVFAAAKESFAAHFKGVDRGKVQNLPSDANMSKKDAELQRYLQATA